MSTNSMIPNHLPDKMAISMFIWNWIAMAAPGEPYDDLEQAVAGLAERGFNAVRIEAGLNWCFHLDGRPRGVMAFGPWIAGYRRNLTGANYIGGARHDVLARLIHLMTLAKRYGIYVILSSWEYQDSTWIVADPQIRAEVMGIPLEKRFMHMAHQHDRLLRLLKEKDLHRNIAFIEVHNEPEYSLLPDGEVGTQQHEEAIDFLHAHHPDILVSGDFASHNTAIVPRNIQVYDQHLYIGGDIYFKDLYEQTIWHKDFDPANPRKVELLDRLLQKTVEPLEQFMPSAMNVREFWRKIDWLYYNLDTPRFDEWILEAYLRRQDEIAVGTARTMAADAEEARQRNIPLVCDEGGFFYPPLESKFELIQPGLGALEMLTDLAIRNNYWGFMPSTYSGPEQPLWEKVEWLQYTNRRFLTSHK